MKSTITFFPVDNGPNIPDCSIHAVINFGSFSSGKQAPNARLSPINSCNFIYNHFLIGQKLWRAICGKRYSRSFD